MKKSNVIILFLALIGLSTVFWMYRAAQAEQSADAWAAQSSPVSSRSRVGQFDSYWQGYTKSDRDTRSTPYRSKEAAESAARNSYIYMVIMDSLLLAGLYAALKYAVEEEKPSGKRSYAEEAEEELYGAAATRRRRARAR